MKYNPKLNLHEIADDIDRAVCVINNGNKKEREKGFQILAEITHKLRK